jgi:ketosteroid isomerase-like protein
MTLGLRSTSWWSANATPEDDRLAVAALDLEYQAAVKRNDAAVMDRILHPSYALVLGDGTFVSREELLDEARLRVNEFQIQDEEEGTQIVRVWGDTAVVTAKLRIKGSNQKGAFDRTLWFSDTYVRTPTGWRYAFAQASLPLPPEKLDKQD